MYEDLEDPGISPAQLNEFIEKFMDKYSWRSGISSNKSFFAKYIVLTFDSRFGDFFGIKIRTDYIKPELWKKIPKQWKEQEGLLKNIIIRNYMGDGFNSVMERLNHLLVLAESEDEQN